MSRRAAIITTSWDDGHPLDMRLADLLVKHNLPGTFYVPVHAAREGLTASQLRHLSGQFEIGSHTMHEVLLTGLNQASVLAELRDSKSSLEQVLAKPVEMFCPVGGQFASRHIALVRSAGYIGLRSNALLSVGFPRVRGGVYVMPTTVQAFPHSPAQYIKNILRRRSYPEISVIMLAKSSDWLRTAEQLLERVSTHGGVFHLWGHSWEIDEYGEWDRLDQMLALMRRSASHVLRFDNAGVCRWAANSRTIHRVPSAARWSPPG